MSGEHTIHKLLEAEVTVRLTPVEWLLKNLKGEIPEYMRREYLPKAVAYEELTQMTVQDFGDNVGLWEAWIREQEAAGVEFRLSEDD
jgi:hypothetical protein